MKNFARGRDGVLRRIRWVPVLFVALLLGGCATGEMREADASYVSRAETGGAETFDRCLLEDSLTGVPEPEDAGNGVASDDASIAETDTATYRSASGDGALLTVQTGGDFVYRIARRYTYIADADVTFDLRFTLTGALSDEGRNTLFGIQTATVACTELSNADAAVSALVANGNYSPVAFTLNVRMLSGEMLTLDEFLGSGAFAALTEQPRYVTFDAAAGEFSLDRPLYPLG